MQLAKRLENIAPFHVMRILESAQKLEAQGYSVCHMEVGEPDFDTAEPVLLAGQQALSDRLTKYTAAQGLPELRERIADFYWQRFQLRVSSDRIVVTPGASGALQLTMGLLLDPGDEILLTDPGYPCNRHLALLTGAQPIALPVAAATAYQPTPEQVRSAWNPGVTRALMLASPSNPTGTMISRGQFSELVACVRELGGTLVVDEIYQGLVYGQKAWTVLEEAEDVIVINSFSKYFGMTGWRIGWMVAPERAIDGLIRLAQNSYLATTTTSQHAAIAALSPSALAVHEKRRSEFQERRDYLIPALEGLGFVIESRPEGAFYLYANCEAIAGDSSWLVEQLLSQALVACTPGDDFGRHGSKSHVRFAYTQSIEQLREGVERMRQAIPFIHQQWCAGQTGESLSK